MGCCLGEFPQREQPVQRCEGQSDWNRVASVPWHRTSKQQLTGGIGKQDKKELRRDGLVLVRIWSSVCPGLGTNTQESKGKGREALVFNLHCSKCPRKWLGVCVSVCFILF